MPKLDEALLCLLIDDGPMDEHEIFERVRERLDSLNERGYLYEDMLQIHVPTDKAIDEIEEDA